MFYYSKSHPTVKWFFKVVAHPDPGYTWIHPSGDEIDFSTLKKYEMEISETGEVKKSLVFYHVVNSF